MNKQHYILIFLPLIMLLAGCTIEVQNPSLPPDTAAVATATPQPTETTPLPAASPTLTPSASPTPLPTETPSPTATAEPPPTLAPSPTPTPTTAASLPASTLFDLAWDDRSAFISGLIPAEQPSLEKLPGATVYHIALELANDMVHLQGQEQIRYTNTEEVALSEIYFRLFPNLAGGQSTVSNLSLNGQPVEASYELRNSAMRLPLDEPLLPGEAVVIGLDFKVDMPVTGGNYGTFAYQNEILALAHFYPMVAVYDDEGWNVEVAPPIGDVVYADNSFYHVQVTAPASVTVVSSGSETGRQSGPDQQTLTFAAGPVRDFYLAASSRYTVTSRTVGETVINSYAPAEFLDGANAVLDYAANALNIFNARYGAYPFSEMDLVSTTTSALGIEYPGIMAILVELYDRDSQIRNQSAWPLMESVVAHEVAHQWFYSAVGNDQVDEPWLDEAMAQLATLHYYADIYGEGSQDAFRASLERRWQRIDKADIPIGLPVGEYTPGEYSGIVYGRGPLFVESLGEVMGAENFDAFLKDYYQRYRWDIVRTEDFQQLAESHCDCDLGQLFEEVVYPRETPERED